MVEANKGKHPYEDIMNLQRHVSSKHEHMSIFDRAAQFSPFAALTGFDGAIKETARMTDQRIELDETAKTILDERLRMIQEQLSRHHEVEFVYFQPDKSKAGGRYLSVIGDVKKIDEYEHIVILQDGTRIPIEEIIDVTGEIFQVIPVE